MTIARDLPPPPVLMGIVNVTPDSFSDGGQFTDPDRAAAHALRLIGEGADIIDIGGESTRPGAQAVTPAEEIDRVVPVIERLRGCGAIISIDTRHAATMRAAVAAGAGMVNDVSALCHDPDSLPFVAQAGVKLCLMHMKGEPRTMQERPVYRDVVTEVYDFLVDRVTQCETSGIGRDRLVIDPGIGFGKGLEHNIELIRNVSKLKNIGVPILIGASRKRFISQICADVVPPAEPAQRVAGSIAAALHCWAQGASIFRVHDVAETRQAFAVARAVLAVS